VSLPAYTRMLAKVRICETTGCWLFEGALDQNGHGNVYVKRADGRKGCDKAHKVSYEHHHGPVPPGKVLRHTCDVRNCVFDDHLILGTQLQNVRDMIERNRAANQYGPYTGFVEASESLDNDICPF